VSLTAPSHLVLLRKTWFILLEPRPQNPILTFHSKMLLRPLQGGDLLRVLLGVKSVSQSRGFRSHLEHWQQLILIKLLTRVEYTNCFCAQSWPLLWPGARDAPLTTRESYVFNYQLHQSYTSRHIVKLGEVWKEHIYVLE
jgi:hypothetical protein